MRRLTLLIVLAGLSACTRKPAEHAATPAYTVGPAYQAGGIWFYPRERFQYEATGLAALTLSRTGTTADGERIDPAAMSASHPTLQLPSVVRVTNLDNGRQALVRLNDRGPTDPGRLISLGPRAAAVLGATDGTRVRVELDEGRSRALAEALHGTPALAIAAAPVTAIQSETLAPPPGVAQSARGRAAPPAMRPGAATPPAADTATDRLPDTYMQGRADPGQLFVRASEFGRMDYAQGERRKLAGLPVQIERVHEPRQDRYRVRAGPFATVAQADDALRQALNAGVADARIVVE